MIGLARGAKAGKNLGVLGAIAGGALGSVAGGATDAIAGNAFLNREQKSDEIIRHALSEGALSLVSDTLFLGGGKFIQKAINPRNIFNVGVNASTGGLYALGKHIVTGNAKGAERILNETISENERQAIRELVKQFGGELRLTKADGSKYREELIKKVGEDSKILKGYDALRDAFLLQNQAKKQEAFIQAIRSDETGNAIAFLSEAANSSPIANANLKKILNKTTENLKDSLRQLELKDYEVKSIFDNLEQGTKESYEKALDGLIGKIYDKSYKTNLRESIQDITAFETFVKGLREQGKFDPTANSFLNQIEKNIYSPDGVNYDQLRNARQMINAYERNVKDPSTLGYIKKISAQFLREDIDKGIENILKQNTQAYEKLSDLHKTAINDYKNMKKTLELVDSAKIRDREITKEKSIENLIKVIQAQGEKDLSNYALLTKGLSEQDKEKLELSILNTLMEKSIKQGENLKVFDSTLFFDRLSEFKGEVFTTPKAKQYIDIAKGFDKLFRNDATIAGKINYTTTKDIKSPLATSLEGAFNQKLTQRLVSNIVRNIPTTRIFKKLDELSGGAALKYHIQRALERSHTISEFSKRLELSAKNSKFSNATMRKIEEITQGVQSAKENIAKQEKALQDAITPLKQFGKNYAEFALIGRRYNIVLVGRSFLSMQAALQCEQLALNEQEHALQIEQARAKMQLEFLSLQSSLQAQKASTLNTLIQCQSMIKSLKDNAFINRANAYVSLLQVQANAPSGITQNNFENVLNTILEIGKEYSTINKNSGVVVYNDREQTDELKTILNDLSNELKKLNKDSEMDQIQLFSDKLEVLKNVPARLWGFSTLNNATEGFYDEENKIIASGSVCLFRSDKVGKHVISFQAKNTSKEMVKKITISVVENSLQNGA